MIIIGGSVRLRLWSRVRRLGCRGDDGFGVGTGGLGRLGCCGGSVGKEVWGELSREVEARPWEDDGDLLVVCG